MNLDYDIVLNKKYDKDQDTYHIATNLENYEAARSGFFICMPSSSTDPVLSLIADKVKDFDKDSTLTPERIQELLKLNITKSKAPHFSVEVLKYQRGNEVIKFAGVPTWDAGSLTIDDIVGVDTKSIIEAWLELCYNLNTRTGGRMYEYKMDWDLVEYTQDYRPIRTWHLTGCFVSGYSESGFDKESDGKRSIEMTLEYDRATMVRGTSGTSKDTEKIRG